LVHLVVAVHGDQLVEGLVVVNRLVLLNHLCGETFQCACEGFEGAGQLVLEVVELPQVLLLPHFEIGGEELLGSFVLFVGFGLGYKFVDKGTHWQDIEVRGDGLLDRLIIHDETAGTGDQFLIVLAAEPDQFEIVPTTREASLVVALGAFYQLL
jgi:hypothetical protein